jgi:UDP-N-acetylmuramoyl-tripeptide--D-alanyl-D-alanine ligase
MTFDPYKLIKYHLYLLQLENYELFRFFKLLLKKGWFPPLKQRKNLVWTKKSIALFVIAEVLTLMAGVVFYHQNFYLPFAYAWQRFLGFLVVVYILDFFTPITLTIALYLLLPFDLVAKWILVFRAKNKIKTLSNLKIVAVAGSYGKTTMKEVLGKVLSIKYKVLSTPDSINTPVGIARWILEKVDSSVEILVVEMGEHYRGDVEELCKIAKPEAVVITGINEAHLERMKSLNTIVATIFEAVSASKPKALILLNADDKNVLGNYKDYVWPDHRLQEYKVESIKYKVFNTEKLCWEAKFDDIGATEVWLLGEYVLADVDAAIKIAKNFGVSNDDIKKGIAKILPVEHRLQPIRSANDILVIDDSYNGNPDGVTEAIKVLSRFTNRRKIYITPGLVEMGKASEEIHKKIGQQLVGVVDIVILIKNSVTPWIAEGIKSTVIARSAEGAAILHQEKIASDALAMIGTPSTIWFDTVQEAHASLDKILKPGDVVLFQNDWGDSYL